MDHMQKKYRTLHEKCIVCFDKPIYWPLTELREAHYNGSPDICSKVTN